MRLLGSRKKRWKIGPSGWASEGVGDLAGEPADLLDEGAQRGDQAEHDVAAGVAFEFAGVALGALAEAFDQLGGGRRPQ